MAGLASRVQRSFAIAWDEYQSRLESGLQPPPPAFVTSHPIFAFLDYRNTRAMIAGNAVYLVVIALLFLWMRNRPQPFELRYLMIAYNAVCVALAGYVCVGVFRYKVTHAFGFVCNKPDFSPAGIQLSVVVWAYYAQKFLEFGDTIFFVLRKSFRQLTVLHLYHHVSITFVTAAFFRFDVNGDDYLAALVNSFVHVLMYSHYLLSAFKINAWWKKQLTTVQLIQFSAVLFQTVYAYFIGGSKCGSPDFMKVLMIVYQCSMLVLFGLFYISSYASAGKRAKRAAKVEAPAGISKKGL